MFTHFGDQFITKFGDNFDDHQILHLYSVTKLSPNLVTKVSLNLVLTEFVTKLVTKFVTKLVTTEFGYHPLELFRKFIGFGELRLR